MRDDLSALGKTDESRRDALWREYYSLLQKLQENLLENIRQTSKTTLQKMAIAVQS